MESLKSHADFVQNVFHRVANKYDLMNDLMSFGIHRIWKRKFIHRLSILPDARYVDVAAGTGDISRLIYKEVVRHGLIPNIVAIDPNESMLQRGKAKFIDQGILNGIDWVHAAAETLPLEDNSVDAITISFGLRNVSDISKALNEFNRVLKPGGQFLCLEFSRVQHKSLRMLYSMYSSKIIPRLGKIIVNDSQSYKYLIDSIQCFPDQEALKSMIESAGFRTVSYTNLSDGVVAIHEGWK